MKKIIRPKLEQRITKTKKKPRRKNQFVYIKKKSTETTSEKCVKTINELKTELNHKIILLISFDITGAFNNVKWSAILERLEQMKLGMDLINIIKNFLTNREIRFYNEAEIIRKQIIRTGVAQGSALSPTIFNIAMGEVHQTCKLNKNMDGDYKLPDDLLMITGIENIKIDIKHVNNAITIISKTLQQLGLSLNPQNERSTRNEKTLQTETKTRHRKITEIKRTEPYDTKGNEISWHNNR